MSPQQPDLMPSDNVHALAADGTRRHRSGFWAVAFAFLIVMASATLPSPLYGLYRTRDHLSAFTVTVIYAIYAAGTIAALLSVRLVAARIGRRGVMLGAVATMMAAAGLLAAWKALPGLLVGRFITGVAVGLAAGTAITYLIELRARQNPKASVIRARNIGTAVNVGALGIGPLIAGFLAEWVKHPLTLPYLLWVALGAMALIGLVTAPETGTPAPAGSAESKASSSSRSVRLLVPAAAATLAAFSANGLFAGLSGLFLTITFHHPSHALAGVTLFLVFASGVASQLATSGLPASRVFVLGTISMLIGLALLVTAVRLSTPSLVLFLLSGALIGAGAGALFKGTTGLVLEATAPENRLAMTSDLLIALFVGLSIPVIGAGVALDRGASPPDTVLGFAIVVGLGVAGAGAFLGHALSSAQRPAGASSIETPHASI
jgi:predicted MFS family arabinose efflux permease